MANRTFTYTKANTGEVLTIVTPLTDTEANNALRRITGGNQQFAAELADLYQRRRLTAAQTYWFHKLAFDQVTRERANPPVQTSVTNRPLIRPQTPRQIEYTRYQTTRVAPITSRPDPINDDSDTFSLVDGAPETNQTPDLDENKVDSLRACLLIYDIPTPRRGQSEIPNPSGALRRIAIRINKSCWVIQEGDIPYAMLDGMARRGVSWHVVRFDSNEGRRLVKMAIEAMQKEVNDVVERSRQVQVNAEGILDRDGEAANLRAQYLQRAKQIQDRFNTITSDLEAAAERFGINPRVLRIEQAHNSVRAIQTAMQTRCRMYVQAAEQARATGTTDGAAMANAMQQSAVPAGIAADFLDENGQDGSALRTAFEDNDG